MSDSDSDDEIPALMAREDGRSSSSSDDYTCSSTGSDSAPMMNGRGADIDYKSSDSNSIPDLLARGIESDGESDGENSTEQFPILINRPGYSEDDSDESGGDIGNDGDSTSLDSEMPDLTERYGNDSSDDNSSIPGLLHRRGNESEESSSEDESVAKVPDGGKVPPPGKSPPSLTRIDKLERLKDRARKMKVKDLKKNIKKLGVNITGLSEKEDLAVAYARAMAEQDAAETDADSDCDSCPKLRTPPKKETASTEERQKEIAAEKKKHTKKKPSQLRKLLEDEFGIQNPSLKTKADLLNAYAKAIIEKKAQDAKESKEKDPEETEIEQLSPLGLRNILENRGISTENLRGKKELEEVFFKTADNAKRESDEEITMPPAIDARDPPKTGAWILSPRKSGKQQSMELTYAFPDGERITKTRVYASYRPGSVLLPGGQAGSIWVYYQDADEWALDLVKSINLKVTVRRGMEKFSQIIVQDGIIWALKPSASSELELVVVELEQNCNDTKMIRNHIPIDSQLLQDRSGGVWVHVKASSDFKHLQPGLWHFVVTDGDTLTNRVVLDENCLLSSDSSRVGVLILQKQKDGKAVLYHNIGSERKEQKLNVEFDVVQSIVDDGSEGALVHYKGAAEWKLANASFGSSEVSDRYSCPKNSQLATNGSGAVWVLKKSGRKGVDRGLQYLNAENTIELSEKYPAGSILG